MVQFVPFQRSASVSRWLPGGPLRTPTAVHAFAALHDTPARTGVLPSEGFATCWRAHAVPSQRSASATWVPSLLTAKPTAVQALAEVHDTWSRSPPFGLGVDWMVQVVPFQRSASGA